MKKSILKDVIVFLVMLAIVAAKWPRMSMISASAV